jgi:hypothetical protein
MLQNATYLEPKEAVKFYCDVCDFTSSKKSNFDKHNLSRKHKNATKMLQNAIYLEPKNAICNICNKTFKHPSSMYRHKKTCKIEEKYEQSTEAMLSKDPSDKELIMLLIKENSELKNMMMKVIENGTHNTTNSHNKSFNLQFFLNETCKDAMNIMDFVDSIKLQLSDLEKVGEIGYVDGISNIITTNLKALDVTQRPIHCADRKRETLYIKDENKWEKEDDEKNKLRKAIKRVACKNQRLIPKFKEAHPDCIKAASKFSDQYNKMIIESMGGSGDNDLEKEDKIIKKITKEVVIDKMIY